MRIAVIHHRRDRGKRIARYLIADFCRAFEEAGHTVIHLSGATRFEPADVAILHVNLSVVPEDYLALVRRYPVALNSGLADTRKRRVSQALIGPDELYEGPVIVKTDLNHGGVPERSRRSVLGFHPWWTGSHGVRPALPGRSRVDYPIFESVAAVPPEVRNDPSFVVEKFLPEREGATYFVRQSYFLGDRHITWRLGDDRPIVRAERVKVENEIATPSAIADYRRRIGLEYGKIDYLEHLGTPVVIDVNKTLGGAGTAPSSVERLSAGIASVLHGGAYGTPDCPTGQRPDDGIRVP